MFPAHKQYLLTNNMRNRTFQRQQVASYFMKKVIANSNYHRVQDTCHDLQHTFNAKASQLSCSLSPPTFLNMAASFDLFFLLPLPFPGLLPFSVCSSCLNLFALLSRLCSSSSPKGPPCEASLSLSLFCQAEKGLFLLLFA